MTTSAVIVDDSPQADTSRHVRYEFTHAESGIQWKSGQYTLTAATDAQAFGDARAVEQNDTPMLAEVADAQSQYYAGVDMDDYFATGAFLILSIEEVRSVTTRDAANLALKDPVTDASILAACATWTGSMSPAVLATALTNDLWTWTNQQASNFSSQLDTIKVAVDNLQGQGPQNVLFGVDPD